MAEAGNSGIFWKNGVSDEEQPLAFVPGVDRGVKAFSFNLGSDSSHGSAKRATRTSVKRVSICKNPSTQKTTASKPFHSLSNNSGTYMKEKLHRSSAVPAEYILPQSPHTVCPVSQMMPESNKAKNDISLKDLCPEDKRRIANLIEELARVSEEKEESVQRLKDEQGNCERKIQQLEQQNLIIAQERESLQRQYRECQELLGLYQQYLSQQQAQLNQSIAQLSQPAPPSGVLGSEEAPGRTSASRANGSAFDGSYLGLAATGARRTQVYRSGDTRRRAAHKSRCSPSPSCCSELSPSDELAKQHGSRRGCREPHTCHRCQGCQGSCHGTSCGTQQWKSDRSPDMFSQRGCDRSHNGSKMDSLTRPSLGHEDWEKKRHQLLIQKMQLESEREKLQARLAEQEERLNRQSEQLKQSFLDHSRIQQHTQAELSSSNTRNGAPEPEGLSCQDLSSRVCKDAEAHPEGQSLHEKHSQSLPVSSASGNADSSERSQRDMATSPAKPPEDLRKPVLASENHKSSEPRLDLSMGELLEMFSPVSEKSKPSARRTKPPRHRSRVAGPQPVFHAAVGPRLQHFHQDLEESRILEDIFFIC
ncbi:protein hinderin isoform X1 [Oryzias melastigma]|uniref:protein hinderin isoform X1 n=1 Tax=Oryzias melastigma TaxID=30732 RepID=UPI000CF829F5|nr:protein hinderin isoform X1 [Oryzias melastigma]